MYKEFIICIIVVFAIVGLNQMAWNNTEDVSKEVTNLLDDARLSFKDETDDSNEKAQKVYEKWEEVDDELAFYIEHNELEKIKTQIIEIKTHAETEDYDHGIENIDVCKYLLEHLEDKTKLTLDNIF